MKIQLTLNWKLVIVADETLKKLQIQPFAIELFMGFSVVYSALCLSDNWLLSTLSIYSSMNSLGKNKFYNSQKPQN